MAVIYASTLLVTILMMKNGPGFGIFCISSLVAVLGLIAPQSIAADNQPVAPSKQPKFMTAEPNGGWSTEGYYVHNNIWNKEEAGPQTLSAYAFNNWSVISTQSDTTSVKSYPNVHKDINNLDGLPLSRFNTITSTFAGTSPHTGIYNVAYDIWLNGVGWGKGSTELMIWTENFKQVPAGTKQNKDVSFDGKDYEVWRFHDRDANVITLVAKESMVSGKFNLKQILNWAIVQGWLPKESTIYQIGYGVEICSTDNKPETFTFTDFSVTME